MRIAFNLITFALLIFSSVEKSSAQSINTDYNGDAVSEFTLVNIGTDKALSWSFIAAGGTAATDLGSLGEQGDHLILAQWQGLPSPQIGVVSLDDDNKVILWRMKDTDGVIQERTLGARGQTVISGGDFDGNGIADAAVAKLIKKKNIQWNISYDMFTRGVGQEAPVAVNFGVAGDRIFYASPDGVSDWLGAVGKAGKKSVVRFKSMKTGEVQTISRFPALLSKDPRPRPFPVRRADGIDALAFAIQRGKNTKVYVYNADASGIVEADLAGTGDIIVGEYDSASAGEELAIKTAAGFTLYNPFNQQSSQVSAAAGIPVDAININTLGAAGSGGGGNGGGGSGGGGGSVNGCGTIQSWPGTLIYKTVGSDHFVNDPRRFAANVIAKFGFRGSDSCIEIFATDGTLLGLMGYYGSWVGGPARWYGPTGCGTLTLSGSGLGNKARQVSGSTNIIVKIGSECYGPIDATKCIGSVAC